MQDDVDRGNLSTRASLANFAILPLHTCDLRPSAWQASTMDHETPLLLAAGITDKYAGFAREQWSSGPCGRGRGIE